MQVFRLTRVIVAVLAAVVLLSAALLAHSLPAGAVQPDPTRTPRATATPDTEEVPETDVSSSHEELPFVQSNLTEFTGDVARPNGMAWLNGNIYIVCAGDQTVYKLYGTSGITDTYIYGVRDAHTIYAEEQENQAVNLWVPDYRAGSLLRVTAASVEEIASGMFGPWGIAYLDPTTFLISNRINGVIELVTREGERTPVIEGLSRPTGLDHDGQYLYVANSGDPDRAVEWYPLPTARNSETVDADVLVSGPVSVMALRMGPDRNLYFAYDHNGVGIIGRVDPEECRANSGCTLDDVEPVVVADLEAPLAGLTFSPDGRLFFHERYGSSLYWVPVIED
jgi:hypothetical protein